MKEIRRCLTDFKFQELFIEHLGWNRLSRKQAIQVDEHTYVIEGAAEKSGLAALVCTPAPGEPFPGTAERKRLERAIEKDHHEHLIIFVDADRTRQIWSIPRREGGKTKGTSEIPFFKGKGVEHLARRVEKLSFSLDESESATLIDVSAKVNQALLAEKVTKKFFKEFSDQRKSFVQFLGWIEDESKRDWYCSVLLNRLMFIYFLGGKGFLPGGTSFLANNLEVNAKVNGPDTFYTHFLLPLSFFGLGEQQGQRGRFEDTFKDVLYLDGGLFAVHQVERDLKLNKEAVEKGNFPPSAKIPDAEFQRWFAYFDKWRWTLEEDKVENDGYISPHILGYIFEKYINQKQMGAYYTKEDITGYICRNTIIPRLFDMLAETGAKGSKAVRPLPIGPHPSYMNEGRGISDGEGIDRYVYPSVKQEAKLPTETDYEQEQRRKRYEGILEDFDADKIRGIDDFITYNLNIEKLALDFVSNIQDPEVLHAFYFRGIQQVTVLDPTCGSGAFLLAALNILYPLYNAALSRMRFLIGRATGTEPDVVNWAGRLHFDDLTVDQSTFADLREVLASTPGSSKVLDDLRAEVERINDHPSAEYFIKKSIIVNNLFGVDIMEEAVEICKLRLFLTLIATVERDDSKANFGVEPLPDIDFNILAGNTLVGYTSIADIDRLWREVELGASKLAFDKDHSKLTNELMLYSRKLEDWRRYQLGNWRALPVEKQSILDFAKCIKDELNQDLWRLYRTAGFATKQVQGAGGKTKSVELTQVEFKRSHEPFHWLLEFPSIAAAGGFEVVVGNPPYVELKDVRDYQVVGFKTHDCGDLYALVTERVFQQVSPTGRASLIVPISMFNTDGFKPLQVRTLEFASALWISTYANRPSQLFDGAQKRLTIFVAKASASRSAVTENLFTSKYLRWLRAERDSLMDARLQYAHRSEDCFQVLDSSLEKLGSPIEKSAFAKVTSSSDRLGDSTADESAFPVYYTRKFGYFLTFLDVVPQITRLSDGNPVPPSELKKLCFDDEITKLCAIAILSSSTFFWFWNVLSDVRNVNKRDLLVFPLNPETLSLEGRELLATLATDYLRGLKESSSYMTKSGLRIQTFNHAANKPLLDQIDSFLADHFDFNEEEADFIKRFDIKYRSGQSEEEGEED